MSSSYEDRPGSYWRPVAFDGRVDFIQLPTPDLASEAEWIFRVQWDYVSGTALPSELDGLPDTFMGVPIARTVAELDDLARRFEFDVESLYRELFG